MIVLVMLGKAKIGNTLFETTESVFVNKVCCLYFFIMSAIFDNDKDEDGDMIMKMAMKRMTMMMMTMLVMMIMVMNQEGG